MQPIGRHEHDALADDVEGVARLDRFAVDQQPAALRFEVAGEDVEQRLLALTLEGHEPEHLARRHGERHVLELASGADVLGLEDRTLPGDECGRARSHFLAHADGCLAEHRRDDLRLTSLAGHERRHIATITQHRAHVAVSAHLGQAVGDEQDRAVALLPPLHHGEDALGQVGRQCGGDLVEHEQFGIERQRPCQVEHAQERQRQVAHLLVEIEPAEFHRLQLRFAPRRCRRPTTGGSGRR